MARQRGRLLRVHTGLGELLGEDRRPEWKSTGFVRSVPKKSSRWRGE